MSPSSLYGKRIVNTRAIHQAPELDRLIEARGGVSLSYPCIAIEDPEETGPLDNALSGLQRGMFAWLVFTSSNAVHAVARRMSGTMPGTVSIAAVGPATADDVFRMFGRRPELVPHRFDGRTLASEIPVRRGQRVLIPAADIAGREPGEGMAIAGAEVTTVVAYRTVTGSGGVDLPGMLERGEVDAITLASSSAVRGLLERLSDTGLDLRALQGVPVVCIGPSTLASATQLGMSAVADSVQGLEEMVDMVKRQLATIDTGVRM